MITLNSDDPTLFGRRSGRRIPAGGGGVSIYPGAVARSGIELDIEASFLPPERKVAVLRSMDAIDYPQ